MVRKGRKQLSELERRPVWRRRVTLTGAMLLWLSGLVLWITTASHDFTAGFASPWPQVCIAGWASFHGKVYVMYSGLVEPGLSVFKKEFGWGTFIFRLVICEHSRWCAIQVPWRVAVTIAGLLPALAWRDLWRGKRMQSQIGKVCLHCGYDLRESSDRCPECGGEIPTPVS